MKFSKFIVCCFLFLALPYALNAQAKDAQKTPASLRGFVQGFYDWYVPKALGDNAGPAWDLVLRSRSSDLSPQLVQALREDLTAQAKAKGEIVGLDFDPFLARSHQKMGATELRSMACGPARSMKKLM
jgi:hypothetical protein